MHLLLFNLATDANDPILGFTSRWIWALAKRVEFIHVITMRIGQVEVPENVRVYSVGKEKGYSESRRAVEFYRHLLHILQDDHIDVCFSHMIPIFTLLAAPVLKLKGIPVVTWYAHRQVTSVLKLAHRFSCRMVSVNEASYPYRKDKLVSVGHGIDTSLFLPALGVLPDPYLILSVGRLSPIKGLDTLLHAVALLRRQGVPARCVLVGGAPSRDGSYVEGVRETVKKLSLEEATQFIGPLPQPEVAAWYWRCALHVNCGPQNHSIDKAPLEAMACGVPSLSSVEAYRETFGRYADDFLFRQGDAEGLATRLARLLALSSAERAEIGAYLRQQVVQQHSVEGLTHQVVDLLGKVSL